MSVAVELARTQWEEGYRRVQARARDRVVYERLMEQVDLVTAGLRARVGQHFTLGDLTAAYDRAEEWVRSAVADEAPWPGWPRTVTTATDAAFHLYARGASDFEP